VTDMHTISWPEWKTVRLIETGKAGTLYEIRHDGAAPAQTAAVRHLSVPQNPERTAALQRKGYDADRIRQHYQKLTDRFWEDNRKLQALTGHPNIAVCQDLRRIPRDDGMGWDLLLKIPFPKPLETVLPRNYDENFVVRLGIDLCKGLEACQEIGLLHGDLTPRNLFIGEYGAVQLGNFGIGKILDKRQFSVFTSPEASQGIKRTIRSDLFSVGMILYWLMNGRTVSQLELPLPAPAFGSSELLNIVRNAAAFHPQDRYASAAAMRADLEALLGPDSADPFAVWEPDLSGIPFPLVEDPIPGEDRTVTTADSPREQVLPPDAQTPLESAEDRTVLVPRSG